MKSRVKLSQVLPGLLYFVGVPAILLLLGGDIQWWQAWAYIGSTTAAVIISRVLVARKNPDLIEERAGYSDRKGTKGWDKVFSPLVGMWLPLTYFIVAGLDKRFEWSPTFSMWVNITALIISLLGIALSTWALVVNRFFSAVVRIQADRGQHVVQNGPYRLMRHPGYSGGILSALMFPLITNSLWAYIPVIVYIIVVVIRTSLEDKTLKNELKGYEEYSRKVRFRLLPGIW